MSLWDGMSITGFVDQSCLMLLQARSAEPFFFGFLWSDWTLEAAIEPSRELEAVPEGGGGGPGANYGSELGAHQIAIWLPGCKSTFPEPLCRNAEFNPFGRMHQYMLIS